LQRLCSGKENDKGERKMKSKGNLTDMNNLLMESMEWVNDRDIKGADLKEEMLRAETKCKLAQQIIANGRLIMEVMKMAGNGPNAKKINHPLLPEPKA